MEFEAILQGDDRKQEFGQVTIKPADWLSS